MALDYLAQQFDHTRKIGDANVLVDTTALPDVLTVDSAYHRLHIQKVTFSITTHFAGSVVAIAEDSGGPFAVRHTDAAAGAGVLSVVTWDFGPEGRALTQGANLEIIVTTPGVVGIVHVEAYQTLAVPVAVTGAFSPADISGLGYWLRADKGVFTDTAGTTLAATTGDNVKCWTDQKNGLKATEATTPPTYSTDIVNGYPAVLFDPATTTVLTGQTEVGAISRNVDGLTTFVVAVDTTDGTNARNLVAHSTVSATTSRHVLVITAGLMRPTASVRRLDADAAQNLTSGAGVLITQDEPFIYATVVDHANALGSAYRNGTEAVASTALTSGEGRTTDTRAGRVRIGASLANTPAAFWEGYIAEILVYRRTLTTAERRQVEAYLGTKYDIAVV